MYPSGQWDGFWFQEAFGKQKMTAFALRFSNGKITGEGGDVVGRFTFAGTYDIEKGDIAMVKQYIGKHRVHYSGKPDGEGCIGGTWMVEGVWKGPFLLRPVIQRPRGDEPIEEME